MHGEEITDESRSNNNNDNIYVQFAAVYTSLKEKLPLASFAWTTLLSLSRRPISTLLTECSSGRAGERVSECEACQRFIPPHLLCCSLL